MCRCFFFGMLFGGLVFCLQMAKAEEPAGKLLNELRDRGEFQKALEYLDSAATDGAVAKEFKETLQFERGMTLALGSRQQRDPSVRSAWLADGQKALQLFLAEHPASPQAIAALQQLGNIFVEQARGLLKRSESATGAAQAKMLTDSNQLYAEALAAFEKLHTTTQERLKEFPAVVQDPKRVEERERLRMDFLQARLLLAATLEESAETHPKGSPEEVKALTKAAESYEQTYKQYRTRLAGLYARLYQARCKQKLGKHPEALEMFDDLLANADSPAALHTFKVKVVDLAIDSWMVEKQYQRILDTAGPILQVVNEDEEKTHEIIDLRVKVAVAAKALADAKQK